MVIGHVLGNQTEMRCRQVLCYAQWCCAVLCSVVLCCAAARHCSNVLVVDEGLSQLNSLTAVEFLQVLQPLW